MEQVTRIFQILKVQAGVGVLKCSRKVEGHVADWSSDFLQGWFGGHVSHFDFERYDSPRPLFEIDLERPEYCR